MHRSEPAVRQIPKERTQELEKEVAEVERDDEEGYVNERMDN